MPIGAISNLPAVILDLRSALLDTPRPKIADVGMGFGIYGAAVRQWIDLGFAPGGIWRSYMQGVEGFAAYRNPVWGLYDFVHVCRIEDWIPVSQGAGDRYHAIFFNDVIEHLPKPVALAVIVDLKKLLEPLGRLYISTPGTFCEQGAVYGNELEVHRTLWTADELEALGFRIMIDPNTGLRFDGRSPDAFGIPVLCAVFINK